jgi:hypothetical protein
MDFRNRHKPGAILICRRTKNGTMMAGSFGRSAGTFHSNSLWKRLETVGTGREGGPKPVPWRGKAKSKNTVSDANPAHGMTPGWRHGSGTDFACFLSSPIYPVQGDTR